MKKNNVPIRIGSEMQRRKVREMIKSGEMEEIYDAVDKLSLSSREKVVLKALLSRELVRGQIGNAANSILDEIRKTSIKSDRGSNVGIKVWNVLNQLIERGFVQVLEGYPKIYVLNRELNPVPNMCLPYSLLTSLYEVLPELKELEREIVYRADLSKLKKPTSGVYSTNDEYCRMLIQLVSMSKKEILGTSQVAQTYDEFPDIIYTFENAVARGVNVYYLLSTETPQHRIHGYEELGAEVRIIDNKTLQRNGMQNIDVFDQEHFMEVNRYEYGEGEKVRFGLWCRYNKMICTGYVNTFWKIWKNAPRRTS